MKILYLECGMGAAGDMLMSALYELLDNKPEFIEKMNNLSHHGIHIHAKTAKTCGITGTHMEVLVHGHEEHEHHHDEHTHHHHHHKLVDVEHIISHLNIPENVKTTAYRVYDKIAKAEAIAHGTSVDMVHFHEVGALDAICDVVGASLALHMIDADKIIASPICTGSGFVKCAHGIVPVPAPATAEILRGYPSYAGDIESELCTPTGAAILTSFANGFGKMPTMICDKIGYGIGTKEFKKANCVRAFIGETMEEYSDEVSEISCNIDDMTAEALAYASEKIMQDGALDIAIIPAIMKKGRPANILLTLTKIVDTEKIAKRILKETRTNGLRIKTARRMKLKTEIDEIETSLGSVKIKRAQGYGIEHLKPEYSDITRISQEKDLSFEEVTKAVETAIK